LHFDIRTAADGWRQTTDTPRKAAEETEHRLTDSPVRSADGFGGGNLKERKTAETT